MSPFKIIAAAAAVTLVAAPALAATKYQSSVKRSATKAERITPARARAATGYARESSVIIPLSSPTPPSRAYLLTPGDPYVISNEPGADTRANRARFGGPMSRGGRMTAPVGD
jgi:hypothetical protein